MAIRSTDEEESVENSFHVCEVDLVVMQIAGAIDSCKWAIDPSWGESKVSGIIGGREAFPDSG
jgi:hypothetical protein